MQDGVARAAAGPPAGAPAPTLRLLSMASGRGAPGSGAAASSEPPVQRLELELDTGRPGAWGVMNITGPVLAWSLSHRVASTDLPQVRAGAALRGAGAWERC